MDYELEQIFLYVTLNCNASCEPCYIRNHYCPIKNLPFEKAKEILLKYLSFGAHKLTLLGGEPTLYKEIFKLIEFAKSFGYEYIRIQTNGQFTQDFLKEEVIKKNVDTFSFSIDGATEKSNSLIRTGCSLERTLFNMMMAKKIGYDTRVNITITSLNLDEIFDIFKLLSKDYLKPSIVYLNIVFPIGGARDNYILCDVNPIRWLEKYEEIRERATELPFKVKLPIGFSSNLPPDHQCIALTLKRLYIMPNGDAYPCILFIDKPSLSVKMEEASHYLKTISKKLGLPNSSSNRSFCPILSLYNPGALCLYYRKIFGGESHGK